MQEFKKHNMRKIVIAMILLSMVSCNQKTEKLKIGYINLGKIYNRSVELKKADSLKNIQDAFIQNYTRVINLKLQQSKLSKKALESKVKAYNDTITATKRKTEKEFIETINKEKLKIQKTIDELSLQLKYDFVLSTQNSNILYAKDTTNNITDKIIEALKK